MKDMKLDQPITIGDHLVPAIWRYLLPKDFFGLKFPSEPRATCGNCPKIASDNYLKAYRCCTYNPRVPNFMLGLALLQDKKASKKIHELNEGGFLIPEGLIATPQRWSLYLADLEEDLYGRSERVRCQFLNPKNGLCGIYNYRNAVCSTFYCLHNAGEKGKAFWEEVQTLVSQCELSVGQWMMAKLELEPEEYFENMTQLSSKIHSVAQKNEGWSQSARKILWGKWYGNEIGFFEECGQLVIEFRDSLWEIANVFEILESETYDKATIEVVPEEYKDQVDPEDFETGETIAPKELFRGLVRSHNKLYTVPGGPLALNPKCKIILNPKADAEERFNSPKSHLIEVYTSKSHKNLHERIFISGKEFRALMLFENNPSVDFELHSKIKKLTGEDPTVFISRWVGQKVIKNI